MKGWGQPYPCIQESIHFLTKFDLICRKAENIKTNNDVFDIDYSHVPPILEQERKKAIDYLKEALDVKDDN